MFMTRNELKILQYLYDNCQPIDIVNKHIPKQIVYPAIKNLYKKGLVHIDLKDTQKVYHLTDRGEMFAWAHYDTDHAITTYKKIKRQRIPVVGSGNKPTETTVPQSRQQGIKPADKPSDSWGLISPSIKEMVAKINEITKRLSVYEERKVGRH